MTMTDEEWLAQNNWREPSKAGPSQFDPLARLRGGKPAFVPPVPSEGEDRIVSQRLVLASNPEFASAEPKAGAVYRAGTRRAPPNHIYLGAKEYYSLARRR